MIIYKNINEVLTLEAAQKKDGRNLLPEDISILHHGAIVFEEDEIVWVGDSDSIPVEYLKKAKLVKDLEGYVITPELVDSHTHLIFGGNRANEYQMRLNGADYEEIAKAGGGIVATSKGTNNTSDEELLNSCRDRIKRIASYGVGTIEVKSGYSLSFEGEMRMTKLIAQLKKEFAPDIQIFNTFMPAHAIPKNYDSTQKYMDEIVIPLLHEVAPLNIIDCVDIFHEQGYFDSEDVKKLAQAAQEYGIPLKTHADEFNDNKGAILACELGALSTDHLLCTTEDGIKKLAESKTVATVLPGTGIYLGKPKADAKQLADGGCKLAIASDYNPGSCHCDNLLLLASICAPMYKINMTQMWAGITLNAAAAVGKYDQGAIIERFKPRFSIFKTNTISEITYNWGRNLAVDKNSI
ncbi:imidazolonepropionase [Halobacteriovorax sp. CON-3]|uniref:imidazolonepropionase n=1 Tax=Halobacteriovorax sp. CON-3 TaxID=3157710 RepID=UPI003715E380